MAGTERIETLISKEALAQFEQLKKLSDENVIAFEKLIAKAVDLNKQFANAKTFKQVIDGTKELEATEEQLIDTQAELAKAQERLKKANHELGDSFDRLAAKGNKAFAGSTEDAFEKLVKLTEELKRNKKAQDDLAKAKGAFDQMDKTLPSVQAGIDKITKEQAELIAQEKLLKLNISDTNKEIKNRLKLDIATPGTRNEIRTTINALKELRDTKIDINTDEGKAQIAELNQEIDRLSKVMEQTTDKLEKRKINIGNYPGAVRVLEQALIDVNKKIDDFTKSGNDNKSMLQSLTKEQELLQTLVNSQTEGFKNATAAIKGNEQAIQLLTQVYGEDSQVVTQLIAETGKLKDEVGDLKAKIKAQASDTKVFDGLIAAAQGLVGVYSVAQGAAALFGDENEELQKTFVKLQSVMAILQGLQAIQNALQKENAARQLITIGLQKVAVLQTNLETASQSKNIIVKYAAIVAQRALNAVMSLAGGPLLAIIGLLALVIISLSSFASASSKAARDFATLNEEFKGFEELLNDRIELIKQSGEVTIAELEKQFAGEKKIRDARRKILVEESGELKRFLVENADAYREAFDTSVALTQAQRAGKSLSDAEKKRLEETLKFVDQYSAARKRSDGVENQLNVSRLENIKANTEEEIKAQQDALESLKINLQTRANAANDTVNNDKKSFEERLKALDEFQKLQSSILQKDTQKQLLVPTLTPSQRRLIITQAKAAQNEINRNTAKQHQAFLDEQANRERRAQYDISRIAIETQAAADQEIMGNQDKAFEDRLFAAYDYFNAQKALIEGQKNLELANATLTAIERTAIEEKANTDILAAKIAFNKQVQDLTLQNLDIESQRRIDINNKDRDEALTALNEQYDSGKISLQKYEKDRLDIERKYTLDSLSLQIDNVKKVIAEYKNQGKDVAAEEAKLAELQKQLSDEVTNKKISDVKKLRELEKQLAQETFDAIVSLVNADFDNQKAKIDAQIDDLERKKDIEVALTNAEAISKQEKEEKIALIEARAQSQREALERRQRAIDLQRARFEKAVSIGRIIADTAAAVVAALGAKPFTPANIAMAAIVGAIGAVQLVKAIATPLPKFATGTDDAPGGLAWVGDGGRSELMVTPQGELIKTPAVPTVMNVPKHSIIFPDAEQSIAAMKAGIAMNHTAPVLVDNGKYYREMTSELKQEMRLTRRAIVNKREIHIHRSKDGWKTITKSGGNETNYLNNNTQI